MIFRESRQVTIKSTTDEIGNYWGCRGALRERLVKATQLRQNCRDVLGEKKRPRLEYPSDTTEVECREEIEKINIENQMRVQMDLGIRDDTSLSCEAVNGIFRYHT
jgi:hypothetical protein